MEWATLLQRETKFKSDFTVREKSLGKRQPRKTGEDLRRQMAETLDFGSTYMLGTAKFKLKEYGDPNSGDTNRYVTQNDSVYAIFECIEPGQIPGTRYDEEDPTNDTKTLRRQFEQARLILSAPQENVTEGNIPATGMLNNHVYKVKTVGTTDFTDSGASQNVAGQVFKAERAYLDRVLLPMQASNQLFLMT